MTDSITDAIWPAGFMVLSKAERETYPRHTFDALTIALEATKLTIEATNDAPRRASHAQPMVLQIFDNLYAQARYAIGVIKPMVMLD